MSKMKETWRCLGRGLNSRSTIFVKTPLADKNLETGARFSGGLRRFPTFRGSKVTSIRSLWSEIAWDRTNRQDTYRLKLVLAGLDWRRWISSTCLRMAFGSWVLNDVTADLHPSNHDEDDMKRELFKISAVIFSIKRTGAPVSTGPDESAAELTRAVNVGVRGVSLFSPSVTEKSPSSCYRQWTEGCPDSSFTTRLTSTHVQLKMSELV